MVLFNNIIDVMSIRITNKRGVYLDTEFKKVMGIDYNKEKNINVYRYCFCGVSVICNIQCLGSEILFIRF